MEWHVQYIEAKQNDKANKKRHHEDSIAPLPAYFKYAVQISGDKQEVHAQIIMRSQNESVSAMQSAPNLILILMKVIY